MRFNSKSVTLNRGVNHKIRLQIPFIFDSYDISRDVWDKSLKDFNKCLDKRPQVSEIINGIKIDILRVKRGVGEIFIWTSVKEKDIPLLEKLNFTFKGKLYYADDKKETVEHVLISDLTYGEGVPTQSIFVS